MSTSGKASSRTRFEKAPRRSLFRRLDIRLPWLKLVLLCVVGTAAILDLCDLTISGTGDPTNKIRVAPMASHVRATERVLEDKKLVALTFDDGPSATTTPRLLDILSQKDAPATFFMLGSMARNNPDIVKRAKREWHEVASHTMYHQNFARLTAAAVQADVDEANSVFKSILGVAPALTRPPYGNSTDGVRKVIGTPIILWSVDTLDWQSRDPEAVVATAMSQVHDGAVILMHDIYSTSVDAVPTLIDALREAGYELATVSELAKARSIKLRSESVYYNFRP